MKRGLMLDPITGKPVSEARGMLDQYGDERVAVPDRIQRLLDRSEESRIMGSGVMWRDILTPKRILAADGAQVLNTTTETIMCPDYTFAADALEVGDVFKYTLLGNISTVVTTPGTITFRLRWGGVGGTILAASGAYAPDPTSAGTTITYKIEYYVVCRALGAGTSGSLFAIGSMNVLDFDDASATTLKGNLDMGLIPVSAPAAVGVNTTAAAALSPTVQFSVSTATTQLTNNIAILESLN